MAESHIVEIQLPPLKPETKENLLHDHPLTQISESPGHLLLLKLYQRHQHNLTNRIAANETLLASATRDVLNLFFLFFLYHSLFLTLLFASAPSKPLWVPSLLSSLSSLSVIWAVGEKVAVAGRIERELGRERAEARALGRCVMELRMKGESYDLSKEVAVARKVRSSSVEVRWRVVEWVRRNLVTVVLAGFGLLVLFVSRFVACGGE